MVHQIAITEQIKYDERTFFGKVAPNMIETIQVQCGSTIKLTSIT